MVVFLLAYFVRVLAHTHPHTPFKIFVFPLRVPSEIHGQRVHLLYLIFFVPHTACNLFSTLLCP